MSDFYRYKLLVQEYMKYAGGGVKKEYAFFTRL